MHFSVFCSLHQTSVINTNKVQISEQTLVIRGTNCIIRNFESSMYRDRIYVRKFNSELSNTNSVAGNRK